MKFKTFLQTARDFNEREVLLKLHDGISNHYNTNGDVTVEYDLGDEYSPCDVAIIIGSWKGIEKGHHLVRTSVANNAKCFVVVETALLGRQVTESNTHYRVGVNGFLNNSGTFYLGDAEFGNSRVDQLGLKWEGWKFDEEAGHVLVMLQLPGDALLRGANIYEWAFWAIEKIREKTDRKIIVRPHPLAPYRTGEEFYDFFYKLHNAKIKNFEFSNPKEITLKKDLEGAWCSVSFSSGSAIDSILNGIPVIATDPGNFAWDMGVRYPEQITQTTQRLPDDKKVRQWLNCLSYSQWTADEMHSGKVWQHLSPILNILAVSETSLGKKK
jgi:hypothetical protein